MKDKIEFYLNDKLLSIVETSFRVYNGDRVSIMKKTYMVVNVSFALDYSNKGPARRLLRCNADVEEQALKGGSDGL